MKLKKLQAAVVFVAAGAIVAAGSVPVHAAKSRPTPQQPAQVARTITSTLTDTAVTSVKVVTSVAASVGDGVSTAVSTVAQTISPIDEVFSSKIPYGSIILREAKKNGIAPELVAAVIKQESKFIATARSPRGALGLMQLLPATGRWMGARNLLNPAENIAAGTRYLKYLSDQFGGNETKVIAAYNAGEGNVRRFGGTPPFHETRTYVHNVVQFRDEFVKSEVKAGIRPASSI
jgi:soluble lytic murein transglycosylase-like protein